jgi:membrane-associated phospholipid phosphatase
MGIICWVLSISFNVYPKLLMKQFFYTLAFILPNCVFAQNETSAEIRREKIIQDIGDYAQHLPAAAALAFIIVNKDNKGFWQFAKSYGTSLGATYVLKYAINKSRPEGATDGHAFPSGHTSVAFSGASFVQRSYGWKYGLPAYAVAGYVAYSRIEGLNDRHDGWDVLGGIVVGVGSTYLFTTPYQQEHYGVTFKSDGDNYLLGLQYNF